jgi:zinc finger SWIM domain-containing protein 3
VRKSANGIAIKHKARTYLGSFEVVKPKDVMKIIGNSHGVSSTYQTVWRSLNETKQEKRVEDDESFKLLKDYMEKLEKENPGTYTSLEHEEDQKTFKRLFICPHATQVAFKTCRPLIIVDACHLRSKYGGIIMSACAHDGTGKILPLALAIAEVENESNWTFFFRKLGAAIPCIKNRSITLMHDREKGLLAAQVSTLPDTYESVCVFHLEKNVNSIFKSKFNGKIWAAAKAPTIAKFEETMKEISILNPEAAKYLRETNPSLWAMSLFPVPRFGCLTSNSAESLNSWMKDLREGSHLSLLIKWISKVATLMYKRKMQFLAEDKDLPVSILKKLKENTLEGMKRDISQFSETGIEVVDPKTGNMRVVKLDQQ